MFGDLGDIYMLDLFQTSVLSCLVTDCPIRYDPELKSNVENHLRLSKDHTRNIRARIMQSANSSMTMASDSQTLASSQPTDSIKPNLPSAHAFDILPMLDEILARIERAPTDNAGLQHQLSSSEESSTDASDIGAHYQDQPPLEPKDLPTEVLAIKAKIRKALRELEKLPDRDWSIEEQEEEIEELEGRIERQKAMLRRFGEMGRGSALG